MKKMDIIKVAVAALSGCIVYFLGAMSRVAVPGMAFEQIAADYGFSSAQISMLPSAGVLGCMVFIGVSGMLVDRFGWARMLLAGAVVQAIGYIPVHESSSLFAMLAGEFVNGGGRTIVYLSILKLFDVSFPRRYFAALIGVFYIFSYGGTLGASEIYPALINWCGSWQLAARAVNYGTFAGALIVFAMLLISRGGAEKGDLEDSSAKRSVFSLRGLASAFASPTAASAIVCAGLNIAVYWSFVTVAAGPYSRMIGCPKLMSVMNAIVMVGMVFMGSVSLLFGNARRPFFLWGAFALAGGFAALLAGFPSVGFVLVGCGYGVTSVLLAGTKESVPVEYMASAIGFTNFFANIVQIGTNQASGCLMAGENSRYLAIFSIFLVFSLVSSLSAIVFCRYRTQVACSTDK